MKATLVQRKCEHCNADYETWQPEQKYCNKTCANNAKKERYNAPGARQRRAEAWEAKRGERERLRKENEEAKAKYAAEKDEARSTNLRLANQTFDRMISQAKDETLRLILDKHRPMLLSSDYWLKPICTCSNVPSVMRRVDWPCPSIDVAIESLERRQATDPFMETGGKEVLKDGAL